MGIHRKNIKPPDSKITTIELNIIHSVLNPKKENHSKLRKKNWKNIKIKRIKEKIKKEGEKGKE